MTDKVQKLMYHEKLIEPKDRVIVGVSGGADSVCLLLLLLEMQEKLDFSLQAVHVEHGIRGAESKGDARFVEQLCEKYQILCTTYHLDVPTLAAESGTGIEEAARMGRYGCYRAEVERIRQTGDEVREPDIKIALAHHADDNAETILFQMIRGSGIDGLCGMRLRRPFIEGAEIIRPMLRSTRREIEQYLKEKRQPFRTDSTNLDTDYSRNRMRHEVLPQLCEINRQAVSHINQSAAFLQEAAEYLHKQTQQVIEKTCTKEPHGWLISQEMFFNDPQIIQQEVVRFMLKETAGSGQNFGSTHIKAVRELAKKQTGRSIQLPNGVRAKRIYEGIQIWKEGITEGSSLPEAVCITREDLEYTEKGEEITIVVSEGEIRLKVIRFHGNMEEIKKKTYTKWLNYDKIKRGLQIRKRAAGDYLTIDEDGHSKKLKEYFINEKIPQQQRDAMWLITDSSHVLWAVGGRMSAGYKIEKNTKRVLEVQIIGGNYHED